jgi:FkbM family methyltransferase
VTRIGYIGNFTRPWCTEVHVANSLRALGHEVVQLQENTLDFDRLQPNYDLLMWTRTWEVDQVKALAALARLRANGVPSCSFHLDRFHGLDREYLIETEPFFRTDVLFTPDDGPWEKYDVEHVWTPPGVYDVECREVPARPNRWPFDVVFVGSHPYPHREWEPVRTRVIDAFRAKFGKRFAVLPVKGRPLRGYALQSLYATVPVVLGDSCLVGNPSRYWSDRIPETLGRGGVLIHPSVDGLDEWYFPNVDLFTYPAGNPEQAVRTADDLLHDPGLRSITRRLARAKVLGRDTYVHRMQTVLDHILKTPLALEEPVVRVRTPLLVDVARADIGAASFELVEGETDMLAVREVWLDDAYPITADMVTGRLVVDIGANVGAFTVLAAMMGAHVLAIEPHPDNYAALVKNVLRNGVRERVRTIQAAVVPGMASVVLAGVGGGVHVMHDADLSDLHAERVPALDPNDVMFDDVHVLKVDCEGGEYAIFDALHHWPAHIFAEWHTPFMPHLTHVVLPPNAWGNMVTRLAEHGRVETIGHPSRGGLIRWSRY